MPTARKGLVAAGLVVGAALLAGPTALAGTQAVNCEVGYVCLDTGPAGPVVRVPSGSERVFSPPLTVYAVANATKLGYCVIGSPSFAVPAGQTVERTAGVTSVEPGQVCPA